MLVHNKRKIINDPVHGFITIPSELIFDIIEHPYFQRLRHIKQLGLTYLVYPGAIHTRFQHAVGALHLMTQAVEMLKVKGVVITDEEIQGLYLAILLHDAGHGPFSHALEHTLVEKVSHETLSLLFFQRLNSIFDGKLQLATRIFSDDYPKKFLHQLVSGQLDVDRLDYLMRDSFFTGVSEGVVSTDRIIKMLNVYNDELVVDVKGVYSIENFIVARRLMYWQVYLHKTVLSAEHQLINILNRAKYLCEKGGHLFTTPALEVFLKNRFTIEDFDNDPELLDKFAELDDHDVFLSVKMWSKSKDKVLALLSKKLIERKLLRIEISDTPFDQTYITNLRQKTQKAFGIGEEESAYFVFSEEVANNAYNPYFDIIHILYKDNRVLDITESSDQLNISLLSKTVRRYFLCYPKNLS
ncbi:MAG TPA: HD domain-containing protein [Bacteroidales bacterium]|nr:HD domain-containing protein [Bacteroidales bacterium]